MLCELREPPGAAKYSSLNMITWSAIRAGAMSVSQSITTIVRIQRHEERASTGPDLNDGSTLISSPSALHGSP